MQNTQSKKFIYYLNGDAQIPAFTLSVVSFHDYRQIMNSTDLIELIEWYRSNACFDGLRIIEEEQERESEAISTEKQEPLDSFRSYSKVIET
ncbi:hypothetical protein ACTNDP_23125 [Paenibacillus barengoltzii]|uniref:hypothetical protein n=1 Tax=Paenibacillus barengoltzii TaxID=343517 RepID=UPI003F890922